MDPTANLAEQLRRAASLAACECIDVPEGFGARCRTCGSDGARLADLVEALHGWISRGGFLPTQWASANAEPRCAQLGPTGKRCTLPASHDGRCKGAR